VKGEFRGRVVQPGDTVWVTISQGMHETLGLGRGDSVVFDVQGVEIKVYISGIREVEWQKDPPNFIFVFPTGVLEEAPQIYVLTTRISDNAQSIRFQQELVTRFPNVSLVDLRLVLRTIDEFFDKVGFIIQFMAMFSILTGLVVLAGAVNNSRYLRMRESVLLRTLGAKARQIVQITLIEYLVLGSLAAFSGILLSLLAGWSLSVIFFKVLFWPDFLGLFVLFLGIVGLTLGVGWFNTRSVLHRPPLEVLRRES
jgi:putative ABC transport system permease protein